MIYLIDTNILLRIAFRKESQHQISRDAVMKLRQSGGELRITSQNCLEFWRVSTGPLTKNGQGCSTAVAERLLRFIEQEFTLIPDHPAVYPAWRSLVKTFGVSGIQVFDARLAAVMKVHAITHILTFNTKDFARYANAGIVAVDPATV